jgi:hypothetical protein
MNRLLRLAFLHVSMVVAGFPEVTSIRKGLANQELQEYFKYDKWLLRVASTKLTSGLKNATGILVSEMSNWGQRVMCKGRLV